MRYDDYYKAREIIYDFIEKDAFGPISAEEVLQEPPLDTYVCGILWPKGTIASTVASRNENSEQILTDKAPDCVHGTEIEDDESDVIREANQFRPSVMAVSFALPTATRTIDVAISAAYYVNIDKPVEDKNYTIHEYKRNVLETGSMSIDLPQRLLKKTIFNGKALMQIVRRRRIADSADLWTISIENTKIASPNEIEQNTSALFQCRLQLFSSFVPIDVSSHTARDMDRQKQDFLYRESRCYAVGHGCSVEWNEASSVVTEISSTFLPRATVSQMIASTDDRFECFHMVKWHDAWKEEGLAELLNYVNTYKRWKDRLAVQLPTISNAYGSVANDILARIEECIERLTDSISVLNKDPIAWRAFCLMNTAMMRQSAKKRNQSECEVTWYPFQLCYVLMCIQDMVNPQIKWRSVVDLLWFPTGGGKTEAYLGVAAFIIFYRRLSKGDAGQGVTVLMRYTLRMLTAQQFERAAALICECELLRRTERLPGGEISIGLWVGGEVTPNHVVSQNIDVETAESVLEKLRAGMVTDVKTSPVQLSACPYCGTLLLATNSYEIKNGQFRTHCPNPQCAFHDDLPVVTVDDDVYIRRPTLLIGTIDKFARLAWEEKTGAIFAEDGKGLPPDLLIQDELHLISGPLGSISGLYEIAVEMLCSTGHTSPKILASTATLCNANAQIKALYGKMHSSFLHRAFQQTTPFLRGLRHPTSVRKGCIWGIAKQAAVYPTLS